MTGRNKLWLTCKSGHTWSALDLPADISAMTSAARKAKCPTCGASKSDVLLAREADIVKVERKA